MFENKLISVVIPCYNEATQITQVVLGLPNWISKIIVVNDKSTDNTSDVVKALITENPKLVLLEHEVNEGVGGALTTGLKWSRDNGMDIAVTMDGDGQMDVADLPSLVGPVASGEVDFSKGNRLFTGEAYKKIPKVRYFGNSVLSMLTKIASGYWHVADSQTGYRAMNRKCLESVDWDNLYKRYGQPNDMLVKLNVWDLKVRDIPINPVYSVGEKSGMRIQRVIFTIPILLMRLFLWRMKEKYIIRNFHPLVFFYFLGFIFFLAFALLTVRMCVYWLFISGMIPKVNALAALFSFMSFSQFTLFAMWFDMESNKELK